MVGCQSKLRPTVFLVDEFHDVRHTIRRLASRLGLEIDAFRSPDQFIRRYKPTSPGCLILNLRNPGQSGPALLAKMVDEDITVPALFLAEHATVTVAVDVMKAGAFDFIEKPFNSDVFEEKILDAVDRDAELRKVRARHRRIRARLDRLTRRERDVLALVVSGTRNREAAVQLGIAPKTVEAYRSAVMRKMQARTLPELLEMVHDLKGDLAQAG